MKVTIFNRDELTVGNLKPGMVFRRIADGEYFVRSSEHVLRNDGEHCYVCLNLNDWSTHRVSVKTLVEPAPNAELTVSW